MSKKTFGTQLGDVAKGVCMTNAERARMRLRLMATMRASHAAKSSAQSEPMVDDVPAYTHEPVFINQRSRFSGFGWLAGLRFVPATLALFAMVGTGVTFAAEDSVPGDILYPVKIHITEEVRGVFSFSEESQVTWEARRAERRLEEAENLASTGKLDAAAGAQIATAFERHSDIARDKLVQLEEGSDSGAAIAIGSRYETVLAAHEAILAHMAVGAPAAADGAGEIARRVRVKAGEVAAVRGKTAAEQAMSLAVSIEEELGMTPSGSTTAVMTLPNKTSLQVVERVRVSADEALRSAEKTLASLAVTLNGESRNRVESELSAARKLYADGAVALELGNTTEAVQLFEQALMRARKIELFMQAETRLNIDLLNNGIQLESDTEIADVVYEEETVSEEDSADSEEETVSGEDAILDEVTDDVENLL